MFGEITRIDMTLVHHNVRLVYGLFPCTSKVSPTKQLCRAFAEVIRRAFLQREQPHLL